MKKTAFLCVGMLLCASTAFAYTNEYSGYSINNKTPEFIMESKHIYGYKNSGEDSLHAISAFNAEEMSMVIDKPFSTAYFDECYNKLAVLNKNDLDMSMLRLPILDLEKYAMLNPAQKELVDKSILKKEKLKPDIRLDKIAGKKAITIGLTYKKDTELVNTDISFISVNNMLYMLATGSTDDYVEEKKEEGSKASKSIVEDKDKKKNNAKLEAVDRSTLDPVLMNKLWQNHSKFVKLFKTKAPAKDAKFELAYNDAIAAKKVTLPNTWGYAQYNANDNNKSAIITVALPTDLLVKLGENAAQKGADGTLSSIPDDFSQKEVFGEIVLNAVDELFISGSIKNNGKDKELAQLLANPLAAKLQADIMFQEGLKRLQRMGAPYFKLNDYTYKSDFQENNVKLNFTLDATVFEKYDFISFLKLAGTSEKGSCVVQLTKKGLEANPELKKIYDKWSF